MPDTLDVSCPNCGKTLKVPAQFEGRRVKCKGCEEGFVVTPPGRANAKPAVAVSKAAAPPVAKPETKPSPFADDDDEDDDTPGKVPKAHGVIKDSDVPRCPHCAKDLDPPDAAVCIYCGFNNITRIKANTKKVIASDAGDWASHLAPGIIALILAMVIVGVDIYCAINMRKWLEGSMLELDEVDLTGRKKMVVPPGAFIAFILAFSAAIVIPSTRFFIRRLIFDYKPEEKVKK